MTDKEAQNSFNDVWLNLWNKYKDLSSKDDYAKIWEALHEESTNMKKKYPLMEEAISRMTSEIIERARGRGRISGDYHRPPT